MDIISNNIGAWLAASIVALLTIFSDKILERIRFRLNRADLRTKYFEELATDLSTFVFFSEIFHERYQKGWTNDAADLASVAGEFNDAITVLRKKEFVYRAWVRKYWGPAAAVQFSGNSTVHSDNKFYRPEAVAPIVLNAVRNNRPLVFDHAEQRRFFKETYSSIVEACYDDIEAWEREHGTPDANPTGADLLD